jgi:hypothetical protein
MVTPSSARTSRNICGFIGTPILAETGIVPAEPKSEDRRRGYPRASACLCVSYQITSPRTAQSAGALSTGSLYQRLCDQHPGRCDGPEALGLQGVTYLDIERFEPVLSHP